LGGDTFSVTDRVGGDIVLQKKERETVGGVEEQTKAVLPRPHRGDPRLHRPLARLVFYPEQQLLVSPSEANAHLSPTLRLSSHQ
jgi:hypothetical protein